MRTILLAGLWLILVPCSGRAQRPADLATATGPEIFQWACANCHGTDGRGLDRALVGFEEELPDFTDCRFASREPAADWVVVAHEGGPIRGFSRMMPAFRGALTPEQLAQAVDYVKSLCTDDAWPRGELNLPRALHTEKAFPEDEWVIEAGSPLDGDGAFETAFIYEQRFGARAQLEVKLPYAWRSTGAGGGGRWVNGMQDAALALKYAFHHNYAVGTIAAITAEASLPTGDESKGLGADGIRLELFGTFGKLLPSDAFIQVQTGVEAGLYDGGEAEGFGRLAFGRTWTSGPWGRSWTPMVELLGVRELEGGAPLAVDVVPQMQISLNQRQHVLFNMGVLFPVTATAGRSPRLVMYLLLDWFDGGFFEGW